MSTKTMASERPVSLPDLRRGLLDTLPLLPGVAVAALTFGVLAHRTGLTQTETGAMSVIVFSGAAQFAVLEVWQTATPLGLLILAFALGARHLLMGASLADRLRRAPRGLKGIVAFGLTDESYALTVSTSLSGARCLSYLAGSNVGLFTCWILGSLAGVTMGENITWLASSPLDIVFPLVFLSLAANLITDWVSLVVAVLAAVVTFAAATLAPDAANPAIIGLLASGVGLGLESWRRS